MNQPALQKQRAIETHSSQAEEFATSYSRLDQDPYGTCFAYSRRRLDAWLERLVPSRGDGLRLLDLGCGTGHHLARWRERGFKVVGVDGSEEMLARARQLNPGGELLRADVESVPLPDASVDVLVCIEVLRYLPDPTPCLREMARLLRPDGLCLATALPLLNLNGYFVINRLASVVPAAGLVRLSQFFTTSRRLRRQFQAAGFARVEVHGVYLGPINWVERLARPLLRATLRAWEPLDGVLADKPLLRELSNMFLVRAVRGN